MWGIIPAAGAGTRIQPLAFSKELLPVCGRTRARAPSAGGQRLSGGAFGALAAPLASVSSFRRESRTFSNTMAARSTRRPSATPSSPSPPGSAMRSSARFRVIDRTEPVLIGLPDTIWFPENGLQQLPDDRAVVSPVSGGPSAVVRRGCAG